LADWDTDERSGLGFSNSDRKIDKTFDMIDSDKEGAVHESKGMNKALRYLTSWKEDREEIN
jgi:hypothetical protein